MRTVVLCAIFMAGAFAQGARPSPPAKASTTINGKTITIDYSSPSMRGRKIFGGLVPYGEVWRAGANEATTLKTDADLKLGDLNVPKGSYTLWVLPQADSWMLIVNKQTGQWGTDHDASQDFGKTKMTLSKAPSAIEKFEIKLDKSTGNAGKLTMEWENTVATVPFTVK
ncbi:MAG TPA: DUF2911 domain-containing protein [Bryobacteraceae bacterium]|nr:DUF2911 domain-containing protein [Bryobacteraceae bacterium]